MLVPVRFPGTIRCPECKSEDPIEVSDIDVHVCEENVPRLNLADEVEAHFVFYTAPPGGDTPRERIRFHQDGRTTFKYYSGEDFEPWPPWG